MGMLENYYFSGVLLFRLKIVERQAAWWTTVGPGGWGQEGSDLFVSPLPPPLPPPPLLWPAESHTPPPGLRFCVHTR